MKFDLIAFDADDTLWHTEAYYRKVEARFLEMMNDYGLERETALGEFHRIEIANLPDFGYGIKGFVLSLIEAGIHLTGGRLKARDVQTIIELGRGMVRHEIRLLPGVIEALEYLARDHRLAIITKGDLMDQERKIAVSGLGENFHHIEIVSDKTVEVYAAFLKKQAAHPERFMMIGNSMRSDIQPVLEMGGYAVFVPYETSWAHEAAGDLPDGAAGRFFEIASLEDLPGLVGRIERSTPTP